MENSVTVLIVDDEEAFLDLAKIYLQEKSNNVIIDSISSPLDLSLRLERQTYDVIVSDYEMPHLTGLELLKNLREDGNTIPFIILTGKGREDTVIEALNLGADYYVQKDLDSEKLFTQLYHFIQRAAEKRRHEIQRKQAEDQLKKSLREKEILLKEIHHRVKNNLQIISSIITLQSKTITDSKAVEHFRDTQNRIKSMALIHEKLYRSESLARIDMIDYIQSLATRLVRSIGSSGIRLKTQITDASVDIDTAIYCGLILNELVSNALKHAFPKGLEGEIYITLSAGNTSNGFTLTVRDTGVGLPKDLHFHATSSFGLQLVNTLVEQLKGDIEIDRTEGTEIKITFSDSKA